MVFGRCVWVWLVVRWLFCFCFFRLELVSFCCVLFDWLFWCWFCWYVLVWMFFSWRWCFCGIDGCWWLDVGFGWLCGRWFFGWVVVWFWCWWLLLGLGGWYGWFCVCVSRFCGLGWCGFYRWLLDCGLVLCCICWVVGWLLLVGVCCLLGVNSWWLEMCCES